MKIALCLYGYFNNRADNNAGMKGYDYIQKNIVDKINGELDIFIHSWEPKLKQTIKNLYNPKKSIYEKQKNFTKDIELYGVNENWINEGFDRNSTIYKQCTIQASLGFFYSRATSIALKCSYEELNNFNYDCVIVVRFDLGQRSGWHKGYNVSLIKFNPKLDMNYIYSAMWKQLNAGFCDQWFFSNSENIDLLGDMYLNSISDYFLPNSNYYKAITNGWKDSNANDQFSNEFFKKNKSENLVKYPKWQMINNHILHKWHFMQTGLYEKSKFLGDVKI